MAKEKKLTLEEIKRQTALEALLQSDTITAAAEAAGMSRKTLYNYLNNDEEFVVAYRDIKRAQLRETAGKVQAAAEKATEFMIGLLEDKEAPYPVRLNAASKLLDLAGAYRDIEAQIIENTIKDTEGMFQITHASAV
jgi:hypothetical protein